MKKTKNDATLYRVARPIVKFLFLSLYTPKIEGSENIQETGPLILAGNHTHNFDCLLLLSSTKRSIHFLAKKELWHGPKKIIFANLGLIPVDRKHKDHQALVSAKEYLKNGQLIGIFPEGTTEKEKGIILPFKIGAVKMAYDTNTKIVPFTISGDYKLFSKNLKIVFGKPRNIKTNDLEKANTLLKERIIKQMEGDY